jgi:hypothetical protein
MNQTATVTIALLISGCATIPPPTVRPFADSHDWVLVEDLNYHIGSSGISITVPKGFVTDFASIPQPLWSFGLSPYGRYSKAAIIHDYLYWAQECTKEQADNILLIAMKESDVSTAEALTIYEGVNFGGNPSWQSNQKEKEQHLPRVIPSEYLEIPENVTWSEYRKILLAKGIRDPKFQKAPSYCILGNSSDIPSHS